MPDFGAPIAQNVDVSPNKGLQTLSDLMGLQQKQIAISQAQQNLQTGVAVQQQQQAEAQRQQQTMGERQLLATSMKNGQGPDGIPLLGPNGEADPVAMTQFANKYLPLTGQQVVQNIVKTQNDRLQLNDNVRTLDQNYRDALSGIVRSQINGDPSKVGPAIDEYVQEQGPNAPASLLKAAENAKSLVANLGSHLPDEKNNAALLHLAQTLQPSAATAGEQRPSMATTTGPGGGVQPFQTNPLSPVPMGAQGPETAQGISPQVILDSAGNPHYVGGRTIAAGGPGAPTWTSRPQAEAQSGAAGDMDTHFKALNASAGSLPIVTGLTKTIEGLAPEAFTGPGGDKKQYMVGLMRGFGLNFTGDAQTDTNLLNKAIAQLNISTPAGTDAARALVEAGQPNSKMDAPAIKEAAGTIRGQVLMNQAERNFLQTARYSNRGAGDIQTYQEGRQAFESNADPRIWQYEDLSKTNQKAADAFIAKQPDKAQLIAKTRALISMGFFR